MDDVNEFCTINCVIGGEYTTREDADLQELCYCFTLCCFWKENSQLGSQEIAQVSVEQASRFRLFSLCEICGKNIPFMRIKIYLNLLNYVSGFISEIDFKVFKPNFLFPRQ